MKKNSTTNTRFLPERIKRKTGKERIDVTLPGSFTPYGKVHPLTQTVDEIVEIFQGMGFSVVHNENSPEVETEYFNFDMLNIPQDHPARDMQDTFYTKVAPNVILRSQTSGAQVHEMLTSKPPIRVVAPGRVYRCESVSARKNNLFHQIEGLLVDKDITFADLKGVMNEFLRLYFGSARPTRFRNSFSRSQNLLPKLTYSALCAKAKAAVHALAQAGSKSSAAVW